MSKYGYRKSPQYAGFAAYMDGPFSELPANDHGRGDPRKLCFLDMGVPAELIFFLWQASRRAALEEAANACLVATPDAAMRKALGDAAHYVACSKAVRALAEGDKQ